MLTLAPLSGSTVASRSAILYLSRGAMIRSSPGGKRVFLLALKTLYPIHRWILRSF